MTTYPVPRRDTGWGLHDDAECGSSEGTLNFMVNVVDGMVQRGYPWLTLLSTVDPKNPRKRIARKLVDAGGVPILRPFRQPCHPSQLDLSDDFLKAYRDEGGVRLVIIGNEPNLILECTKDAYSEYTVGGLKGKEAFTELLVEQWLRNADQVRKLGMIPLFPGLAPTGEDSNRAIPHHWFYNRVIAVLKGRGALAWAFEGTGLAIHNRPGDGSPLDETHTCSINDHRWIQQRFEQEGLKLPMYGTEAGYEDGNVTTYLGRYEGITSPSSDQVLRKHKELNQELLRRFRLDHSKAWSSQWKCACLWLASDGAWFGSGIVANGRRNGEPSYLWRDWQELVPFNRWDGSPQPQPEPSPVPTPEPEPEPTPEVKMRAYLKDGSETDPGKLLEAYSVVIAPCSGPGFYMVEIRERCEAANCDIWVKGQGGKLLPGQPVRWGWPGTEVSQDTGPDGRVGFAMTRDAYYDPAMGGGPHWAAVSGNSETVRGIGMIPGTVHCTLNYTFQYLDAAPEPAPEPPPGPPPAPEPVPEPEPIPSIPYSLEGRLAKASGGFEDLRAQIEAFSDMATLNANARRDAQGNPLFHLIEMIIVHNSGSPDPHTPMSLAEWAVKTEGEPTIPYHFCIQNGKIFWTARLVYVTNHTYKMNSRSIAVCILGDYSLTLPAERDLEALRYVIASLYEFFGQGWGKFRLTGLFPHRYVVQNATACPGKVWPAALWSGPWPAALWSGPWPEFRGSL